MTQRLDFYAEAARADHDSSVGQFELLVASDILYFDRNVPPVVAVIPKLVQAGGPWKRRVRNPLSPPVCTVE